MSNLTKLRVKYKPKPKTIPPKRAKVYEEMLYDYMDEAVQGMKHKESLSEDVFQEAVDAAWKILSPHLEV